MFGRKKKDKNKKTFCRKCCGYAKRKVARKVVLHTAGFFIAPLLGSVAAEVVSKIWDAADLTETFGGDG